MPKRKASKRADRGVSENLPQASGGPAGMQVVPVSMAPHGNSNGDPLRHISKSHVKQRPSLIGAILATPDFLAEVVGYDEGVYRLRRAGSDELNEMRLSLSRLLNYIHSHGTRVMCVIDGQVFTAVSVYENT